MNKTDRTNKRSFFVLSGPPSSRLSAKALKCTKLTPPFGHPECAYMDQAVVATWNSMRSTPSCNIMGVHDCDIWLNVAQANQMHASGTSLINVHSYTLRIPHYYLYPFCISCIVKEKSV